jgi:ABC-type amino acid transport substrate-binding protein
MNAKYFLAATILTIAILANVHAEGKEDLILSTMPSHGSYLAGAIIKEAYKSIDIEIKVNVYTFEGALKQADTGRVDGELMRAKEVIKIFNPHNLTMIPVPLFQRKLSAFIRKDKDISIKEGWKSLETYNIVVVRRVKVVEMEILKHNLQAYPVLSFQQALKMVEKGKADLALLPYFEGLKALNDGNFQEIKVFEPPLKEVQVYHYLNKKHADLVEKITLALQDMERSGRIKQLVDKFEATLIKK